MDINKLLYAAHHVLSVLLDKIVFIWNLELPIFALTSVVV